MIKKITVLALVTAVYIVFAVGVVTSFVTLVLWQNIATIAIGLVIFGCWAYLTYKE